MIMAVSLFRISRLPQYGFRCNRAGLISQSWAQHNGGLVHMGKHMPITCTFPTHVQLTAPCSDLASRKYNLIYRFPAIRVLRTVSRFKIIQTSFTIVILPYVLYLHQQGLVSLKVLNQFIGMAVFATVMLYGLSYTFRRVVGMMYLDSTQTMLRVSHLNFWGSRKELYIPLLDVVPLGDVGDPKGENFLQLKRYSNAKTMFFNTRLGKVIDKDAFQKVFGN